MPTQSKETALFRDGAIAGGIGSAEKQAKSYITKTGSNGVFVHEYNANGSDVHPTDDDVNGVHIHNKVDILRDGDVVASYGEEAVIGKSGETRSVVGPDNYSIVGGNEEPLFDVNTYKVTVSDYAAIYDGDNINDVCVFNLRYAAGGIGISAVREIYLHPTPWAHIGGIPIIGNGVYLNGDAQTAYFSQDKTKLYVTKRWFQTYAPSWSMDSMKALIHVEIASAQSVDTAAVKIGACYPEDNYKLAIGADTPDGTLVFSVDGNGKVSTPQIQSGRIAGTSVYGQSITEVPVAFNPAMAATPTVLVSLDSTSDSYEIGHISVATRAVSTNGFIARIFNAGTSTRAPAVNWLAINI